MALDAGAGSGGGKTKANYGRYTPRRVAPQVTMAPKPKPAPYSPPPSTNSGGNYSGGYSPSPSSNYSGGGSSAGRASSVPQARAGNVQGPGRGGSGGGSGKQPKPKPEPKPPSLKKYLGGDSTFQDQVSLLQKELEDYVLSNQGQRRDLREDFGTATSRMGDERTRALEEMEADFASRGLLNSGLYDESISEYDQQYQQRLGDLSSDRDRGLEDLLESMGMYRRQNRGQRQSARQEAIRRRAEQYGLQ